MSNEMVGKIVMYCLDMGDIKALRHESAQHGVNPFDHGVGEWYPMVIIHQGYSEDVSGHVFLKGGRKLYVEYVDHGTSPGRWREIEE